MSVKDKLLELQKTRESFTPYESKVFQYQAAGLLLSSMRVWYGMRIKMGKTVETRRYQFFYFVSPILLALVRIETELKFNNDHLGIEDSPESPSRKLLAALRK